MNTVFLNGEFLQAKDAKISIFDTGFYYGDGIYEVALLQDGRIVDLESHLARLKYVLKEVKFNNVPSIQEIGTLLHELVKQNKETKTGMIYLQITRGMMENRYNKLQDIAKATILAYIVSCDVSFDTLKKAVKCELIEDPRRYRRDIKMTSLMPMNLAKISAQEKGYDYVIFKDRQSKAVTEGASSNIFIITKEDVVLTHPTGKKILSGCTRKRTIEFLKAEGFEVKEQEFFEEDLLDAKEAFLTGAIKLFAPIESVNGEKIGNGEFEIAKLCTKKYEDFIKTFPQVI
jgi:D-alanine transaminase